MFFIVWGFRSRSKKNGEGEFYCPDCGTYRAYFLMMVKRWFTLYWIPLFPTKDLGEFVECQSCNSTFNDRVLSYDPKGDQIKFEAAFSVAAKRVMFKMALADGDIDDSEIEQITQSFQNIAKREIDQQDIATELENARNDTRSIKEYLTEVAATMNDTGKELVLRSAIAVIKADGHVDDEEIAVLKELIEALDMPKAYSKGVLMEEELLVA
ncbi:TerB family tellurite resistance protein [Flexibacterium corallicola]|uniref:TerB family tellurite resistance protein n=1 Tax=Flexibacterium corallicola TaxID=3037259 RepID=UPI00286F70B7|nr:TerB family tellurite resistance protein [Pseudovibrio sp. M1P-2-3]